MSPVVRKFLWPMILSGMDLLRGSIVGKLFEEKYLAPVEFKNIIHWEILKIEINKIKLTIVHNRFKIVRRVVTISWIRIKVVLFSRYNIFKVYFDIFITILWWLSMIKSECMKTWNEIKLSHEVSFCLTFGLLSCIIMPLIRHVPPLPFEIIIEMSWAFPTLPT